MGDVNALQGVIWRLVRGSVTTGLGLFLAKAMNNPQYLWLGPVILALSKALRDKYPGKFEWLPL